MRPMDTIGRVGGDEFAVIVPGAGPGRLRHDRAPPADGARGAGARSVGRGRASRPTAPTATSCSARPTRSSTRASAAAHAPIKMTAKELSWATALARAVDERMAVQHEHSWKVAEYCVGIADRLGWPERDLELLQMAAILHDVGKVSIPDHVLRKQQPLTERDWEAIKQNPVRGAEMVSRIQGLETIVPWIRHSLERFDGSGYPDGLSGEAIPLACRILHVADAFDAMTQRAAVPQPAMSERGGDAPSWRATRARSSTPHCVETFDALPRGAATSPAERPAIAS